MKIELGQFYVKGDTVYIFNEIDANGDFFGMAWQNRMGYRCSMNPLNRNTEKDVKQFIPIDTAIAKLIVSGQAIDTGVV